jgi:general secretion pathway protein L
LVAQEVIPTNPDLLFKERVSGVCEKIAEFIKTNRIPQSDLYVGIPRDLAIVKLLSFPSAVKENLRGTIKYEMEKYVPLSADEVYFDYNVIAEEKSLNKISVLLVVVKKEIIESCINMKDRLGVGISGIEISSTAISNFLCLHKEVQTGGAVDGFAHLQNGTLEMGILQGRHLRYSRSVRVDAEKEAFSAILKREFKTVAEISGFESRLLNIAFSGPEQEADFFDRFSDNGTQISPLNLSELGIVSHEMIVAFGAALKGFEKLPVDINLLPVIHRKRPSKFVYYVMFFLLALSIFSGIMFVGSKFMKERIILTQLDTEIDRMLVEIQTIDRIRNDLNGLENQIKQLNRLEGERVPVLDVLREISERLPDNAWIQDLRYSEKEVQIYGFADSASNLIQLLEASPLFSDVIFLSTITKEKDGKERFRIGFNINS